MCDSGKWETFCEGSKKGQSARKISRCARNDSRGGMGLFHVAYNGYVGKVLLLYRHPYRSGGIFLAHWYSVLCATAGKGNPSAKEARKSRVQGRFLAALEMTVWENEGSHKFEISNKLTNVKESHLNMSIIVCYIKTSIKAPMLLYQSNDSRGNTVTRAMSFEKV